MRVLPDPLHYEARFISFVSIRRRLRPGQRAKLYLLIELAGDRVPLIAPPRGFTITWVAPSGLVAFIA